MNEYDWQRECNDKNDDDDDDDVSVSDIDPLTHEFGCKTVINGSCSLTPDEYSCKGTQAPSMKELGYAIDVLTNFIEHYCNRQEWFNTNNKNGNNNNNNKETVINMKELIHGIILNPTVFHSLCQCIDFVYGSGSQSDENVKEKLCSKLFGLIDKKRYDCSVESSDMADMGTNFSTLRCLQFSYIIFILFVVDILLLLCCCFLFWFF